MDEWILMAGAAGVEESEAEDVLRDIGRVKMKTGRDTDGNETCIKWTRDVDAVLEMHGVAADGWPCKPKDIVQKLLATVRPKALRKRMRSQMGSQKKHLYKSVQKFRDYVLEQVQLYAPLLKLLDAEEPAKGDGKRGVCWAFQRGACPRGDNCPWEHRLATAQEKSRSAQANEEQKLCRFWTGEQGSCKKGDACDFVHAPKQQSRLAQSTTPTAATAAPPRRHDGKRRGEAA